MQAKWRSGMVATDDYAEPIANLLRIIDTPLNRATLFSGELGRGPRCCFHASNCEWPVAKVRTRPAKADGILIQTSARALPCACRACELEMIGRAFPSQHTWHVSLLWENTVRWHCRVRLVACNS